MEVSERTNERNLDRGVRFLRTLSLAPDIYSALASRAGYTEQDHQEGWALALALMGQRAAASAPVNTAAPLHPARVAIAELDAYDAPAIARSRAVLESRHPEQLQYLLGGLRAETGAHAVGSTQAFLDRYRSLKEGTDAEREASRQEDREAIELLESRRIITPEAESKLREYIEQATRAPEELPPSPDPKQTDAYREAARTFHVWLRDWREQARAVITRRDYLIRLGLASRRSSTRDEEETTDTEDVGSTQQ